MKNILKEIFNDESIIGLCSIMDDETKRSKWIKKKVLQQEKMNSSIIFQRNLNKFILKQTNNLIDQIPYYSSSSSQNQKV